MKMQINQNHHPGNVLSPGIKIGMDANGENFDITLLENSILMVIFLANSTTMLNGY